MISSRLLRAVGLLIAATGTAAAFAGYVAPASGGSQAYTAWCAPGSGLVALDPMFGSGAARSAGDVVREPELGQVVEEVPPSARGKGGKGFRATVPVYFHVVHASGVGNISQEVIDDQMTVLNLAFAGFYGGVDTGFQFELAGVTRTDNSEWHFGGLTGVERKMKRALHTGGWDALNIYATTAGPYLGWAYFPGLPESQQYLDGIVVDWESMPGASTRYAGQFDLGHTATHEAGHWIHLHHVFNGGCNNWGDYVDDTPPQKTATSGCPVGQDSCNEPGLDSIHNYMDYSFDACYDQFTADQTARMQDAWLHFRASD